MSPEDLRLLLEYHYWARDRLLNAVESLSAEQYTADFDSSFRSIRDTLVHLHSADWVWLSRWRGESPRGMLSPDLFPDLATLRRAWDQHRDEMRHFVETLGPDDADRLIEYQGFDGRTYAQPLSHMLQHVINHGSYHRGQVTTMLRQLGTAPPKSLDLIAFHRERGGSPLPA